jgi:hypothetical protein
MGLKLEKRRELLAVRLENIAEPIRISESIDGSPQEIVAAAKELSLEGIIAKRKDSVYQPGKRSRAGSSTRLTSFDLSSSEDTHQVIRSTRSLSATMRVMT